MHILVDNGEYERMFNDHFGDLIKEMDFDSRTLIEIPNPSLPKSVPTDIPKLLWLRPKTHSTQELKPQAGK